ncbi:MAG: SBBP repeat-containing protein [candidate division Zixibacteria bacterium]|nr:SBBP repeat-containing protein [candidate division Zixibacteria bacterium]
MNGRRICLLFLVLALVGAIRLCATAQSYSPGQLLSGPARAAVSNPVLTFSSYLGGGGVELCTNIRVDDSGYVYLATQTTSDDFPLQNPRYGSRMGWTDVTLTKLAPDCGSVVYSTYFGAAGSDDWPGIAVDRQGCVYMAGNTTSASFPRKNAYDPSYNGNGDLFVTKFNKDGSLAYSTYFGGSGNEWWGRIAVDTFGCAYVAGMTSSTNLPCVNAFDPSYNGSNDIFLAKFSADGSSLIYCTYLGGSDQEENHAFAVDAAGCAYVTGTVLSADYPTTEGAFDRSYNGEGDCYVSKLAADGASLIYSTYIGGSQFEDGVCVTVDATGHAYVGSATSSPEFPTTANAYDATYRGQGGYICKLSENGDALEYSTFLGGTTGYTVVSDIAIDDIGRIIALCITRADDFPVTSGAFDPSWHGEADGALAIISADGQQLEYGTFFGGSGYDEPRGITLGGDGSIFATGHTMSSNFPAVNALYPTFGGVEDAFVVRFETDTDGDGVADRTDNCPGLANPVQEDSNSDGIGDACCCQGRVGNANGLGTYPQEVTISDIQTLVTAKLIVGTCEGTVACLAESDVNQSGGANPACKDITISDIQTLVNHLFIAGPANAPLRDCLPSWGGLVIPRGAGVTIDGVMHPGEWTDAETVTLGIDGVTDVTVFVKHDGASLLVAYSYSYVGQAGLCLPEIFVDTDNNKNADWQNDDWWFHVSASDCEAQGTYGVYTDCSIVQPNWQAVPNFAMTPNPPPLGTFEISIPFSKLGVGVGSALGIAFRVEWVSPSMFGYWPATATPDSPATWGNAIISPAMYND